MPPSARERVSIFEEERKQLKRRLELQEMVHDISSKIRSQRRPERIAQLLADAVATLTSFRNSFLTTLEEDGRTLKGVVAAGHKRTFEIGMRLAKYSVKLVCVDYHEVPAYKKALDTGETVYHRTKEDIVNTLSAITGLNPGILEIIRRTTRMNMAISIPLFVGEPGRNAVPIGMLGISSIRSTVDEEEVRVVRILANQASLALYNIRLFEKLRKQANQAESSEVRFRRIMNAAHDMIISYDPDGRVKFANNALRESRLYSMEGELIDKETIERIYPDDQARVVEAYLELKEGRPIRTVEYRIHDDSGEWLVHNMNAAVINDGDGEIAEIVAFIRDVTVERQRERQIVRRNKELEILNSLITNLASDIEYEEMITRSLGIISEFTRADMITFISLTEPVPGKMNVISNLWVPEEFERFLEADLPQLPETEMFSTREVQVLSDVTDVPERYQRHLDEWGVRTIFSVPVTLRGKAIGYVVGGVKGPLTLDDESIAILLAIGDQLGMVLEITKLKEQAT